MLCRHSKVVEVGACSGANNRKRGVCGILPLRCWTAYGPRSLAKARAYSIQVSGECLCDTVMPGRCPSQDSNGSPCGKAEGGTSPRERDDIASTPPARRSHDHDAAHQIFGRFSGSRVAAMAIQARHSSILEIVGIPGTSCAWGHVQQSNTAAQTLRCRIRLPSNPGNY